MGGVGRVRQEILNFKKFVQLEHLMAVYLRNLSNFFKERET